MRFTYADSIDLMFSLYFAQHPAPVIIVLRSTLSHTRVEQMGLRSSLLPGLAREVP
jgi:hypothetical protein